MIGIMIDLTNKKQMTFYFDDKEKVEKIVKDFEAKTIKVLKIEDGNLTYYFNKDNVGYIAA